ncbi:MAG: hypothetical protein HY777_04025 [Betaproteobacteria bacterium]|nr:hypothetical protein [Betaproteobacteria bacterium]
MATQQEIYRSFSEARENLTDRTLRAGALLRLMQFRFKNGERLADSEEHDIGVLVDVCLESMPHHYSDVNDPLDEIESQFRRSANGEARRAERIERILNAMQIVARFDTSCEELTKAAETVFNIAKEDQSFEPDWRTLVETIEARGLHICVETIGNFCLGPDVYTKEARKEKLKTRRAINNMRTSINKEVELSRVKLRAGA